MQRQIPPRRALSCTTPTLAPTLAALSVTCNLAQVGHRRARTRAPSSSRSALPFACGRRGLSSCGRPPIQLRERTRTDGTEPAKHPPPEVVLASADRDGAVQAAAVGAHRAAILLNGRP